MNIMDDLNRTGWEAVTPLIQAKQDQMAELRRVTEAKASVSLAKDQEDGAGTSAQAAIAAAQAKAQSGDNRAPGELSEEEQAQVDELKARDREVRAHEQAHAAVGGQYAGAPSYTFQTGPDNQ
ncbi:MAG: putative metalloprotease CJM1_0395 family protein, partial [Pseudomonadota bacterium]